MPMNSPSRVVSASRTPMKRGARRSGSVLAYVRPDDVHMPTFVVQTLEVSDAAADE